MKFLRASSPRSAPGRALLDCFGTVQSGERMYVKPADIASRYDARAISSAMSRKYANSDGDK